MKYLLISGVGSWVTEWIDWVRIRVDGLCDRQENIQDDWMAQAGDEIIAAIIEGAWKMAGVHGAEGVSEVREYIEKEENVFMVYADNLESSVKFKILEGGLGKETR